MHIVERSIWINRPPRDIFDFHADHANRAAWHDHVTRSEMITPPPLGFGSRFETALKELEHEMGKAQTHAGK